MAFTCGFFNSQNGDRKYNAEQMASIFDGLIKDGVYDTVGDIFAVTPGTGMQVLVGSGRAWFDHTWNNNDAQYPLAITAADVSLPRYDAVVLETNHSDTVRTNRLRVLTGTPASNPAKPTMASSANVKQHPLAYIRVTAGAKAITQSMIQVVVGTSECPFVTGIIETAQIDALFQQWNGEFNEWFENLKAQLSDNVVANLQGQIDKKVAKADVATKADIEAGTSTTKWVTPKGLKEAGVDGTEIGRIIESYATPGDDYLPLNGQVVDLNEYPHLFDSIPGQFYLIDDPNVPVLETNWYTKYLYFVPTNKDIGIALCYHNNDSRLLYIYFTNNGGKTWSKPFNDDQYVYHIGSNDLVISWLPGISSFAIASYQNNYNTIVTYLKWDSSTNKLTQFNQVNTGSLQLYVITDILDDPDRNRILFIGHAGNDYSSAIYIYSAPYQYYKNPTTTNWTVFKVMSITVGGDNRGYIFGNTLLLYGYGNNTSSSSTKTYNVWTISLTNGSIISSKYTTLTRAVIGTSGYAGHQRPIKFNNKYYLFTVNSSDLCAFIIDQKSSNIELKVLTLNSDTDLGQYLQLFPQVKVGPYFYIFTNKRTLCIPYEFINGTSLSFYINVNDALLYQNVPRFEMYDEHFMNGDMISKPSFANIKVCGVNALMANAGKMVKAR